MNTNQIMVAVERYRTAGGREEHHAYKDQLEAAIEALVQERDALRAELGHKNTLLGSAQCQILELQAKIVVREASRDTYQREADKLAAENKVLRDALETIAYTTAGPDCNEIAHAALTRSKS